MSFLVALGRVRAGQEDWVEIPGLPPTAGVALGKTLSLLLPQFPCL